MNIFSNPYKDTETWAAQGAIVQWGTGATPEPSTGATPKPSTGFPFMMINLEMRYARSLSSFFPINGDGDNNMTKINIAGAPRGTLQVGAIYGPDAAGVSEFIEAASKSCKTAAEQVVISIKPFGNATCTNTKFAEQAFILRGIEMEQLGLNIQGGEAAVVNLPTVYSFTSLEWIVGGNKPVNP